MKDKLAFLLNEAYEACIREGVLERAALPFVEVDTPKGAAHGDYASNMAMVLAGRLKKKPRQIAEALIAHLPDEDHLLEKVEIAGPGFINVFIREAFWATQLARVDREGDCYGHGDYGQGHRIQVEFVSANPTGPLHIGHARGAVVGDVTANILAACGHTVQREYYINDAGNQMHNLGKSVLLRYLELQGETVDFPDTCYRGDYIKDIAARLLASPDKTYLAKDRTEVIPLFTDYAADIILAGIQEDLAAFGVIFDQYFSERDLYRDDGVARLLASLEDKGFIYREEETLWFKSTAFGDDKDRVVVRQNGEPTYFAADIAYHRHKFLRGFETVIDIWGADHHGYIPRMLAGIQALGYPKESLQILLVQLVNLLREGKPVAMSTRSGEFVTLREVVDEVGRDAARYNFLMRRCDSHLDFDLEIAKKQSMENPVYYVQYAHARICSILRLAAERGYAVPRFGDIDPGRLTLPEEIDLIKTILRCPDIIEGAARALEPHRLTFYLNELAGQFHSYYNKYKVMSDDGDLSRARLFLVQSVRTVLQNILKILGVSSPETM